MAIQERDALEIQTKAFNEYVTKFIKKQEATIEKLTRVIQDLERHTVKKEDIQAPYMDLAKALHTIETHRDERNRIMWKEAQDKKDLIFAYLRKAEAEGIDIDKTTEVQKYPTYRRVFQYTVYNIGSWKDLVDEYKAIHHATA